jgi:hypothetical protein
MNTRQRVQVYRNPGYMKFVHEEMPGTCCMCGSRRWTELHHFGDDGGGGMKPNDIEVARLCHTCHELEGRKRRSLLMRGNSEVIRTFERDAYKIMKAWIERGEK